VLIAGQAARATGYGFTAVLFGALLADCGYSHLRAAMVLTALIAGTAVLPPGQALADRVGRRRSHAVFFWAWPPAARWSRSGRRSGCCWGWR